MTEYTILVPLVKNPKYFKTKSKFKLEFIFMQTSLVVTKA